MVPLRGGRFGQLKQPSHRTSPVFEPLKDPKAFARFKLNPETHTLVRPNRADLALEFLHEHARVPA